MSILWLLPVLGASSPRVVARSLPGPYDRQVAEGIASLDSEQAPARARAAEALGFLRAFSAEPALLARLADPVAEVRRQVAMALAWCGGRSAVSRLIDSLADPDPVTRQSAHVALTNISGLEYPFDALAPGPERTAQIERWRTWWSGVSPDRPPADTLELLDGWRRRGPGRTVRVSSAYKGSPEVLVDGIVGRGGRFWQTKNVPFPQWCLLDLGRLEEISRVVVHQYGPGFVMTDCEVATSLDGSTFHVVERTRRATPVRLEIEFPPRAARQIRITSHGSRNPTYPTTFFEVEVDSTAGDRETARETAFWECERGLRALGALGGTGAADAVLACLALPLPATPQCRPVIRAGIRALGRLRDRAGFEFLVTLLEHPFWARYAADALGDFGDPHAVRPLLRAYARYAKRLDGSDPPDVPADDRMSFPSEDRMLETPYAVAFALCRLIRGNAVEEETESGLRAIAPQVMANLPSDHDTFILYEPEVGHLLTRYLLEVSGLRQEACEHAFALLGQPSRLPPPATPRAWPRFGAPRMATWLPALCVDRADLPRLLALLEHEEGWVRLNAAKALAWLGDPRAIEPLARILAGAGAEAGYGYSGTFKDEEYTDPAPRWREGLVRALGLLGAHDQTDLLEGILHDEDSVLEVRHAAARALADLGSEEARAVLARAAREHPFHSIRLVARDALRAAGHSASGVDTTGHTGGDDVVATVPRRPTPSHPADRPDASRNRDLADILALVFIRGDNDIPNTRGTVEQADRWRQTYVVTDSGPAYRPGRNLFVLRPVGPDGRVTSLTRFCDGYVAEPELSWDAAWVIFTRRGQTDPWWHIFRIRVDGSGLEQLTRGPYHDVGPVVLPDGRILFASSRGGVRDEYHGYPCTSLHVMQADGSDPRPIATNIGRDNEPAVLLDGRIVFSRLEVFYSRNKTELTLHAARPDGTGDEVIYGPERRAFWRELDHGPPTPADGQEAPLTHRVLRMTQPQPMPDGRHIVVVTQGGLALVDGRRDHETIITPENRTRSYTTPWPLPDGRILCASTLKTPDRRKVDLGLYILDPVAGKLTLLHNDPAVADFEPRPVRARQRPPILPGEDRQAQYRGRFLCASVHNSLEKEVARRGRWVRLIEGVPVVARHSTQTNAHEVWKNHGGTLARVLGTAPLAADGSFFVEAPADRLLHFQVLDSDRRVIGNQKTWIYPRPGEIRSCVGCHEPRHSAPPNRAPLAARLPPLDFLPRGEEFRYRAKAWFKGHLPPEIEARTRTVRAVNLLAR